MPLKARYPPSGSGESGGLIKRPLTSGSAAGRRSENMGDTETSQEIKLGLHDKTGALLMIDKMERKLIKELLLITLKTPASRDWIAKKLGSEYIGVAEKLLKTMGGS